MLLNALITGRPSFLFDPTAFRHSRLDFFNPTITLSRIIITGVHDHYTRRHIGEQSFRQGRNLTLRDGDYDQVHAPRGILSFDRDGAGFARKTAESVGIWNWLREPHVAVLATDG
jgi:hypothetical protein